MKNTKKILCFLFVLVALTLVMSISIFAEDTETTTPVVYEVTDEDTFVTALGKAVDGDTIKFMSDITFSKSTSYYYVKNAITVDFNGYTLTTSLSYTRCNLRLQNAGCSITSSATNEDGSIKRGTIIHVGGIAIIQVWNADKIENMDLISARPDTSKNSGGISFQEGSTTSINLIKNVSISGDTLSYGIETYNCGNSECIIKEMNNVDIDANTYGMTIHGNCGTVTDCSIHGDLSGIFLWSKSTYDASISLVNCEVTGGEEAIETQVQNSGSTISVTADADTTFSSDSGVLFTDSSFISNVSDYATVSIPGYTLSADGTISAECTGHSYSATEVLSTATCTASGTAIHTCSVCGDKQYVVTGALGHNYEETNRVDATLESEGSVTEVCSVCGDTKTTTLPKLVPTTFEVATKAELIAAYNNAKDGDIIRLTADIQCTCYYNSGDCYNSFLNVTKAITLDLYGHTLETQNGWGGLRLQNAGCSVVSTATNESGEIVRGELLHTGRTCAVKVFQADKIENVNVHIKFTDAAAKTIGGIVIQNKTYACINSIKNVKIYDEGSNYDYLTATGIETYNCGDATQNVIGSMENVEINVHNVGMEIDAPVGTVTNCTIYGGDNGILLSTKAQYNTTLNLVGCTVSGGNNAIETEVYEGNGGTITMTADSTTTFASESGVLYDIGTQYPGFTSLSVVNADGTTTCLNHNMVELSTAEDGTVTYTCYACSATETKAPETCKHENVEVIPAILPTPSVTGYTAGSKCLDCGETVVTPTEVVVTDMPAPSDVNLRFNSINLTLGENISVNYRVRMDGDYGTPYVVFVFMDGEYTVENYTMDGDYFKFNFAETRPHYMNENIAAYVYAPTEGGYVRNMYTTYSIRQYCVNTLNKSSTTDAEKTLLSDTLVLGAKTQMYTGYKTDELITDLVTSEDGVTLCPSTFTSIDESKNILKMEGDTTDRTNNWSTASLMMGETTYVYLKFVVTDITGVQVKVTLAGEEKIFTEDDFSIDENGKYVVNVDYIKAYQYDEAITAIIEKDGTQIGVTLTYSVNTYLQRNYDRTDTSDVEVDMIKALYLYGESAASFFN